MKTILHTGEFTGRDVVNNCGVIWRVDIWRYYPDNIKIKESLPGELTFDGDCPVEIDWAATAKHEVLSGSVCTINIISPGDRSYIDLYTVKAGDIGITIYRDDSLYWAGTLDPEFYEEPYEALSGYTVSLTFSDLGILDRLKYNTAGIRSLQEIIAEALERARLSPLLSVDTSMISLKKREVALTVGKPSDQRPILIPKPKITPVGLADIFVRSDNFYDEDGEALSLKEVIEGVLQPLALRMEQRAGRIYIYDLHGLYSSELSESVVWHGDRQTLGVDEVKNNAIVTWSPYAAVDKLLPEECWPEDVETDPQQTNLDNVFPKVVNGCDIFSYHLTQDADLWNYQSANETGKDRLKYDGTDVGFTIWVQDKGRNVSLNQVNVVANGSKAPRIYKIVPQYDGTESEGVALCWPAVSLYDGFRLWPMPMAKGYGYASFADTSRYNLRNILAEQTRQYTSDQLGPSEIFSTLPVELPPMPSTAAELKISMRMLMDVRFNPAESAVDFGSWPQKIIEAQFNERCNFVYVPVRICYKQNGDGGKTFVWTDMRVFDVKPRESETVTLAQTMTGEWLDIDAVDTSDPHGLRKMSFLAYYDPSDTKERSGIIGWKENRQCIHNTGGRLQTSLAKNDAGQFIPYPPKEIQGSKGGKLWISIMDSRWVITNDTWPLTAGVLSDPHNAWENIMWLLCELPQVEIVTQDPMNRDIEDEDVEYKGEINPEAKDDISIDTICGTKKGGYPTARGAYFDAKGDQITSLMRAERSGQVEDLLIGTLYSQYAIRHTVIEGESALSVGGVCRWKERLQGDTSFITISEQADLQSGISERKIIELSPDEYTKTDE